MKDITGSGTLYVVATPIGNLADVSQRMIEILTHVELIACEDTRHTRKLLSHLQIPTSLTSYYREIEQQKSESLLGKLLAGTNIAVVSDAGTPGLSDPGAILVRKARRARIPVIPVPGPSALATALSVAGLTQPGFYFAGFPPAKSSARRKFLKPLKSLPCPLFFYESARRIKKTLEDCLLIFGDRDAQLFRELTKLHEEHLAGPLSVLLEKIKHGGIRGELVLLLDGVEVINERKPDNLDDLILWYRDHENVSLKDAAKNIASDLDLSRSQVYQRALTLWHN